MIRKMKRRKRKPSECKRMEEKGVSEDDEIDYSVKPEFYDPDLDYKDELWLEKKRQGRSTDAVPSFPGCFTTLCLECQRWWPRKHMGRSVRCSVCSADVDVMDEDEIYHFYNVLPSES